MFRPSSPPGTRRMYTGFLIKDLLETVARAEATARVSATTGSKSADGKDLTRDHAALELTVRKVPAAVSSGPG